MKRIFLIIELLLTQIAAFAQQEPRVFTIQPKLGFNIASYNHVSNVKSRVGFVAGVESEYRFNRMLGLSVGILYSMQGDKETDVINGYTFNNTDKFDYINIPIVLNLYVVEGLAIKTGIQPGFNISSKYKYTVEGKTVEGDYSDLADVKSLDLSIPIGLSYEFKNFMIDGRYNLGVTKLVGEDSATNSVFQFTFGYKFKL